ncbi:ankyrin repeat-containing domain protein [Biscogniauxia marginata]|nr:ankyrin repeat-containing domain protein [Biscogniauxia marginata]
MGDISSHEVLERRRVQNREAQRRFREKRKLQKTVNWLEVYDHLYEPSDSTQQSLPPDDASPLFSPFPFPEPITIGITSPTGIWDSANTDSLLLDDASLPQFNVRSDADSQVSIFSTHFSSPATSTAVDSTLSSPEAEQPPRCIPSMTNTSPSPVVPGYNSLDEHSLSPSPNSLVKTPGGWLSPLHIAAQRGSDRIIRLLLEHNGDCNEQDSDGLTPLMHAVIEGHEEATRLLLKHGALVGDVQNADQRCRPSAIHWAVLKRREGVLRVLLNHFSNDKDIINSYDELGRAPLHIAIDTEFEAGVRMLLEIGADPLKKALRP